MVLYKHHVIDHHVYVPCVYMILTLLVYKKVHTHTLILLEYSCVHGMLELLELGDYNL